MRAGSQKSRWIFGGLAGVVLLVFCGSFSFGREGLFRYVELRRELRRTQQEILLSREQNAQLKETLEKLRNGDPLAMEEEARRHHLVGPNEELYEIEVK
ncbi:MAG: septum formation initiator family protein [bacterium]